MRLSARRSPLVAKRNTREPRFYTELPRPRQYLCWLKPLDRRPCRESGPPQSLQLGPSQKVHRESGLPQSHRSIPKPNSSKAVNPRPCNRARIDFHNCWACGRHSTGLWPSFVASWWLMPGACCALERGARRETCMALCASFASWRLTIQPTSNCTSSNVISSFKYIVG